MKVRDQLEALRTTERGDDGATMLFDLGSDRRVEAVRRSVRWVPGGALMVVRDNGRRQVLAVDLEESGVAVNFTGERREVAPDVEACLGDLDHANAVAVRELCEGARPQPLGLD